MCIQVQSHLSQVTVTVAADIAIIEGERGLKTISSNEDSAEKQFPHLSLPNRQF